MSDLSEMRRVAEAAQTPWYNDDQDALVEFDHTFDPPTVLALLDDFERQAREIEVLRRELFEEKDRVVWFYGENQRQAREIERLRDEFVSPGVSILDLLQRANRVCGYLASTPIKNTVVPSLVAEALARAESLRVPFTEALHNPLSRHVLNKKEPVTCPACKIPNVEVVPADPPKGVCDRCLFEWPIALNEKEPDADA